MQLHKIMARRAMSNVTKIREGKGISMSQLAGLVKISLPYQSQLESGARDPSLKMVCKLAVALGVDPTRLFKEIA